MRYTPRNVIRNKPNSPCWGCEFRIVGCHSTCEDYAAYQKANNDDYWKIREAYRGERMVEQFEAASRSATIKRQKNTKKYFTR